MAPNPDPRKMSPILKGPIQWLLCWTASWLIMPKLQLLTAVKAKHARATTMTLEKYFAINLLVKIDKFELLDL